MTLLRRLLGWRDPPPPAVPVATSLDLGTSCIDAAALAPGDTVEIVAEHGGLSYPAPLVLPPSPPPSPVVHPDEVYDPCWRLGR